MAQILSAGKSIYGLQVTLKDDKSMVWEVQIDGQTLWTVNTYFDVIDKGVAFVRLKDDIKSLMRREGKYINEVKNHPTTRGDMWEVAE